MKLITEILGSPNVFSLCLWLGLLVLLSEHADRKEVYHGSLIKLVLKVFAFDKIMSYNL